MHTSHRVVQKQVRDALMGLAGHLQYPLAWATGSLQRSYRYT